MHYENREFFIPCDGIPIHAKLDFPSEHAAKLPILVIIPGFTGHIEEWHIQEIARAGRELGMATLRAELYGHGKSGGTFYDHTVLLWMSECVRVIDHAKHLPFVSDLYLTGHSQGGLTVVLAAGVMADAVKALIPLSPAMNIPQEAHRGMMLGNAFDNENLPEFIASPDWKLSSNYVRAARMLPVREAIAAYHGPVCVIHGTADGYVPFSYGKELADSYENARLIPIEGDGHCYEIHLDKMIPEFQTYLREQLGK